MTMTVIAADVVHAFGVNLLGVGYRGVVGLGGGYGEFYGTGGRTEGHETGCGDVVGAWAQGGGGGEQASEVRGERSERWSRG